MPDVAIRQRRESRHLRSGYAIADRSEEIGVSISVKQRRSGERRASIRPLGAGAVTRLTNLRVQLASPGYRGSIAG